MAIKKFYSTKQKPGWFYDAKRKEFWSWGFDIRLATGQRRRERGFLKESDAQSAVAKIRLAEKEKKYGFIPDSARPKLAELIEKRTERIVARRERVRSKRVLEDFFALLRRPDLKIDEVTRADLQLYVEKRMRDGLKPQSVNRELNIISATLRLAETFYPQLAQWIPPRVPRMKHSKARRERIVTDEEKLKLLAYLLAPQREEETAHEARARRKVGFQFQFALLTGLRHAEIDRIKKQDIDWRARSLKVIGKKTEAVSNPTRYIEPLTDTMLAILREFCAQSKTDYVFTRSGNTIPLFYRILRAACQACGITYGRSVEGGLILHDARHTATTRMLQAGIDLSTIQSFTGHSDKTMVLYYSHATPGSRARAAEALEAYAGAASMKQEELLTPEMIEALSHLVAEGRLAPLKFAAICRGEEKIPEELLAGLLMPV